MTQELCAFNLIELTYTSGQENSMKLTKLVPPEGDCNDGKTCPAVHVTDGDLVVVQGYLVPEAPLTPPAGEGLVAVPRALLRSLAAQPGEL